MLPGNDRERAVPVVPRPGQRSETIRRANLSAIVRELHLRGPMSRSDLVEHTGLTRSGIRAVLGDLVSYGLVREERAASQGAPGRPSRLVSPSPDGATVLALEIAVDSLAVALVGLGGRIVDSIRVDREWGRLSLAETVTDMVELTRRIRARSAADDSLIGVGVSIVAVVRRSDGFVRMAPNLGWRDVALGDRLVEGLKTSLPIAVANDADLGALAEHRRGAAVGANDVIYISGEVGVGGGLIVDGKPLTGIAGYGGEVGHFPVNPAGRACRCGSVGCWETEVGESALLTRAGRPPDGGRAAVDAVLQDAAAGSPVALAALDSVGRWLGVGLAGLVNVLNPELVVLGGLFGRIYPYVGVSLRTELDRLALEASRELVTVVPATLGSDVLLLGAAELAFEPLLSDPAAWAPRRARVASAASA
ncbi:MAG TPA: ROK family transcriptional regulator [Candidatus Limnocylindrales bacterium]|nr:ROK family transcriptional regulator [Candidatus Limnocylindrales bacterium]